VHDFLTLVIRVTDWMTESRVLLRRAKAWWNELSQRLKLQAAAADD
jgi:hypothetical protein